MTCLHLPTMEVLSSSRDAMGRFQKFIKAARRGDKANCRSLAPKKEEYIENRELISRVYEMALHAAMSGKRCDVLVCLVKHWLELLGSIEFDSTDVAKLNEYVSTVLDFAARNGNIDLFDWVINPNNNKEYQDLCSKLLLSDEGVACVVARALGQVGSQTLHSTIGQDFIEKFGTKPLVIGLTEAVKHDHRDMAMAILSELDKCKLSIVTALMLFCACKDQPDLLKLWYEKSSAVHEEEDWWYEQILTPLYLAAKAGSQVCSHLALHYWGNHVAVNELYFPEQFSALHVAAYYGHEDVVSLLLQQSGIDVQIKDVLGRMPLHYACWQGHLSVVLQLLQKSGPVDFNLYDDNGMTPLQLAICAGHTQVVREWLSIRSGCFADYRSREAEEYTFQKLESLFDFQQLSPDLSLPQILEPKYGNNFTIGELGEAPNLIDSVFWSPGAFTSLHFTAALSHPEVLQQLLTFHCQKELDDVLLLKDSMGFTAYEWAHARGLGHVFLSCLEASKGKEFVGKFTKNVGPINEMKRAVLDNLLKEIDRFEHWKKKMKWCMNICHAVREQNIDEARRLVYQAEHQKLNITCFGKPISESLILHIFPRLKELDPLHIAYCLSKKCMEDGTSRKGIEGLMIHLCQVGKFTSDVLERWLQQAIMFGFHDLAYHLIVTHKVNCNTPVDISYLMAPSSVQLSPFELAAKLKQHRMQTWMANRDDVKKWQNDVKKAHNDLKKAQKEAQKKERQAQKEMQVQKNTHKEAQKEERQVQKEERQVHKEERQAHVDYANTILVGAVLIAGVAYQGWLEPPSGFDENGYAWVYRDSLALQLFWVFNSLSFFLAVVTVISAGMGAIPSNKKEHLADAVTRARDPVSLASICFPMSIICIVIAFASAGFTILPHRMNRYQSIMIGTVLCGAINCYILIMMFIKRNSKIYPSPINSIKMNPINAKTMRTFFRKSSNFLKKGAFLLVGFCSGTIFLFCIVLPVSLIAGLLFLLQKLGKLCACWYLEEAVETALGVIFISVGVIFTFFSKYLYMKDFCDYIF